MRVDRIVSLANAKVRLNFLAMERSLRATGCDLPLSVIPFDETRFILPKNSEWLEDETLFALVREAGAIAVSRKYLAFTLSHSAYFDSDIIHLHNPQQWLAPLTTDAFVVADTEWSKARWTFTTETRAIYQSKSTLWLLDNFNSGFFAQTNPTAEFTQIRELLENPKNWKLVCGQNPEAGEQPGANLLVHRSGVQVLNLCLPPYRMESTMACDYAEDSKPKVYGPNSPAFIHYAGHGRNLDAPIARLIFDHLTREEAVEMKSQYAKQKERDRHRAHWPLWARVAKRIVSRIDPRFQLQWKVPTIAL